MMRRFAAGISLFVLIFVCQPALAAPKTINTQRTASHVSVFTVPVWFAPTAGFTLESVSGSCCVDKKKKVSLEASELRVPYDKLLDEFSGENLKKAGMELKMRSEFIWNGSKAVLMKAFQRGKKSVMGKWLLIVDRGESAWMISGLYDAKDSARSEAVLSMIKTLYWDKAGSDGASRFMAPFGSVETGSTAFKLAGIRQDAFVYTRDGVIPTKSPDGALFVVSRLLDTQLMPEGRINFAKRNLNAIEPGCELEIVSEGEVMTDGLPGVEITAYTKNEPKKLVYQTILFDTTSSHVMVGIARGDSVDALEMFHRLAAGYKRGSSTDFK